MTVLRLSGEEFTQLMKQGNVKVHYQDENDAWPYMQQAGKIAEEEEKKVKRKKYGNRRITVDGMKFDSQHESDYYFGVLVPRIKAGELKYVNRQVPFDLPGGIVYVADFVAVDMQDRVEGVYDAKSPPTRANRVYINKKKQMRACLGVEIKEV